MDMNTDFEAIGHNGTGHVMKRRNPQAYLLASSVSGWHCAAAGSRGLAAAAGSRRSAAAATAPVHPSPRTVV